MTFAGFSEHHRRALISVALALGLAGLLAVALVPVGLFPVTSFPRVRIEVDSGSMPARQMLLEVTQPLEEALRAVSGTVEVNSTTSRGSAEIFVDFPWGSDMTQALLRVDATIAQTLPQLPPDTAYDAIQMSPNVLMPFVSYAFISDQVSPATLRQLVQFQIAPLLAGISGVRRTGVMGGQIPEIEVHVSPAKLQASGLTLADVASTLAATNTIRAVGRLEDEDRLYLAIGNNALTSAESVRDITLRNAGAIIRLDDIATVASGTEPQWLLVEDNGKPAVTLDIYQQDNADSLGLARTVDATLAQFMKTQSAEIHEYKWYDQTQLVRSSAGALLEAILIGLLFAALVILAFLRNWRIALLAMAIVPLAVLITVLLLYALGMSFNIMTLGGIAAAIGLLIDDAIVMIEHIARRVGSGRSAPDLAVPDTATPNPACNSSPPEQVLAAAREFLAPLSGSSLATIIIFIPLAFLSGVTGAFFKFLSLTVASALIISYALAALVIPLLARGMIDFHRWHDPARDREGWLSRHHHRALTALFRRPWPILPVVAALIGIGYVAYTHVATGFLPRMDEGGFVLDYQTAPGTSLTESNRELEQVEAILHANPYVYTYSRRTGAGLGGDLKETYQGDFFVRLVDASRRPALWTVMDQINDRITTQVPGISIDPHQLLDDMIGDMVGRPEPVVIQLSGADTGELGSTAMAVAQAIARVPGIVPDSVNDGVVPAGDAVEIRVDPTAAATHGVTATEVQEQVYHYLNGTVVTRYLGTTQNVGVRLWLDAPRGRIHRNELGLLPIRISNGHSVPLQSLAQILFTGGQPEIARDNLAQVVPVTAEIDGAHDLGTTLTAVQAVLRTPGLLPAGVRYTIGGDYRQQQIAFRGMIRVFVMAAAAELILLLFLYNRFWLPVVILASTVVSSTAVFTGLWLTGTELNITALMGMVMVIGIATEMAIFFASEYQSLEGTMPPRQALQLAARNRLRPITMSTLAMMLALLPLGAAISGSGDQMLQPLAIAIIAGILVQLPLVLLVLPVVVGLTVRNG